jgi:hypothetical protein
LNLNPHFSLINSNTLLTVMNRKRTIRCLFIMFTVLGLVFADPQPQQASACPMCKVANEEDDARPKAYMYSIIFMLSVPAVMVAGITGVLFSMHRKEQKVLEEANLH